MIPRNRQFVCFLHPLGWDHISFGISLHLTSPNIEIHLPFCFIRFGWQGVYPWNGRTKTLGKDYKL